MIESVERLNDGIVGVASDIDVLLLVAWNEELCGSSMAVDTVKERGI